MTTYVPYQEPLTQLATIIVEGLHNLSTLFVYAAQNLRQQSRLLWDTCVGRLTHSCSGHMRRCSPPVLRSL